MSSPLTRFTMVVFPALSKPTIRMRTSFSFALTFLMIVRRPIARGGGGENAPFERGRRLADSDRAARSRGLLAF